jgi:hypothetical protein
MKRIRRLHRFDRKGVEAALATWPLPMAASSAASSIRPPPTVLTMMTPLLEDARVPALTS